MKYVPSVTGVDFRKLMPRLQGMYSDDVVLRIAKEHAITDKIQIQELGRQLRECGAIYLEYEADWRDFQKWERRKKEISMARDHLAAAKKGIWAFDPEGAELFWSPQRSIGMSQLADPESRPFGHSIRRLVTADNTIALIYLRQPDFYEALTVLENYAEFALTQIGEKSGGRPGAHGLELWVGNMRLFWTGALKRRFTFDAEKGRGISPAARFCRDAIRPLDPSVTESNLATAIRKAIRKARNVARAAAEQETGKNPP